MGKQLRNSSHHLVMITGDHALTATYVALKTYILKSPKDPILGVDLDSEDKSNLKFNILELNYIADTEENSTISTQNLDNLTELLQNHDQIVMTGPALNIIEKHCKNNKNNSYLEKIIPMVSVFARTSPQQKENIINTLKDLKFTTLMCGDGTNDVGALKHAHVGIALLAAAEKKAKRKKSADELKNEQDKKMIEAQQLARMNPAERQQKKMDDMLKKMQEDIDERPIVKLGD